MVSRKESPINTSVLPDMCWKSSCMSGYCKVPGTCRRKLDKLHLGGNDSISRCIKNISNSSLNAVKGGDGMWNS